MFDSMRVPIAVDLVVPDALVARENFSLHLTVVGFNGLDRNLTHQETVVWVIVG